MTFGIALSVLALLCGCAARPDRITVGNLQLPRTYPQTVALDVQIAGPLAKLTGLQGARLVAGEKQAPLNPAVLKQALASSILANKLFSSVVETGSAYRLRLFIVTVDQEPGLPASCSISGIWVLSDQARGTDVFETVTRSHAKATIGDAVSGDARLRVATERAAAAQIQQGLMQLAGCGDLKSIPPLTRLEAVRASLGAAAPGELTYEAFRKLIGQRTNLWVRQCVLQNTPLDPFERTIGPRQQIIPLPFGQRLFIMESNAKREGGGTLLLRATPGVWFSRKAPQEGWVTRKEPIERSPNYLHEIPGPTDWGISVGMHFKIYENADFFCAADLDDTGHVRTLQFPR